MAANYQKLYSYLVGQIDDTLQLIAYDLTHGQQGFAPLNEIGLKLKQALLTAEEIYLNDAEA